MKTCNIIIPAWGCEKYIMNCVKSVYGQLPTPGWEYRILFCVDACQKTAAVLTENKIPFMWSEKNMGHYVMRNSAMYQFPADVHAYFDGDDIMVNNYVKRTLAEIDKTGLVMCAKWNCNEQMVVKSHAVVENGGAMTFTDEVLKAVGGFVAVRCAADTDFLRRIEMAGFSITKINEGLYYRRSHPGALTKKADTGMGSPYRKKVWSEMCAAREKGIFKIDPVTVKLEAR